MPPIMCIFCVLGSRLLIRSCTYACTCMSSVHHIFVTRSALSLSQACAHFDSLTFYKIFNLSDCRSLTPASNKSSFKLVIQVCDIITHSGSSLETRDCVERRNHDRARLRRSTSCPGQTSYVLERSAEDASRRSVSQGH